MMLIIMLFIYTIGYLFTMGVIECDEEECKSISPVKRIIMCAVWPVTLGIGVGLIIKKKDLL